MPFDGTNLNEVAAHLLRAKRHIEENGWCPKGSGVGYGAPRCVGWAINDTAIPRHPRYFTDVSPAIDVFRRANSIGVDPAGVYVAAWNDAPDRTLKDVYAAFDEAIALALAEERAA